MWIEVLPQLLQIDTVYGFVTVVREPLSTHIVHVCDPNNFNSLSVFYGLNNVHLFLSMLLKPAVNLKMT